MALAMPKPVEARSLGKENRFSKVVLKKDEDKELDLKRGCILIGGEKAQVSGLIFAQPERTYRVQRSRLQRTTALMEGLCRSMVSLLLPGPFSILLRAGLASHPFRGMLNQY